MGCAAPNPFHWQDLRQAPLTRIISNKRVKQLDDDRFCVRFINVDFLVDRSKHTVTQLRTDAEAITPSPELQILLIRYLLCAVDKQKDHVLISEKELPGGATFFRGPHSLPVGALIERFGHNSAKMLEFAKRIGAEILEHGDASFYIEPLGGLGLCFVLWQADEEFPASMSVLLDRSMGRCLELDTIFLLIRQSSLFLSRL